MVRARLRKSRSSTRGGTLISATTRPSRTMVRVMSASSVSGTCALVAHRVRQRCAATPAPSERARGQVLRQPSTWVDTLSVQPVWIYPVADLRSYMVHGGAAAAAGDEGTVRGVGMAQVQDRRRGGCGRRCGYRPATEGTGSTVATISQRTQVVEERVDRPETILARFMARTDQSMARHEHIVERAEQEGAREREEATRERREMNKRWGELANAVRCVTQRGFGTRQPARVCGSVVDGLAGRPVGHAAGAGGGRRARQHTLARREAQPGYRRREAVAYGAGPPPPPPGGLRQGQIVDRQSAGVGLVRNRATAAGPRR